MKTAKRGRAPRAISTATFFAAGTVLVSSVWAFYPEPAQAQPAPSETDQAIHVDRAAQRAAYKASLADHTPRGEHAKMIAQGAKARACLPQERAWHGGVDGQEDIYCLRRCTADSDCMGESARCVLSRPHEGDDSDPDEPFFAADFDLEADEEGMCMPRRFLLAGRAATDEVQVQ